MATTWHGRRERSAEDRNLQIEWGAAPINTMHTLIYAAGNGPVISDGVHQAVVCRAGIAALSYLAPGNPNLPVDTRPLIEEAITAPVTR